MTRLIHLGLAPWTAVAAAIGPTKTVYTPSRRALRALQAVLPANTMQRSLWDAARKRVQETDWRIATALTAQTVLRRVLQQQLGREDVAGEARTWGGTVTALLQSGALSEERLEPESLSRREARLVAVALAYRQALHAQTLLAQGELFGWAAAHPPTPHPVLIYGYPQPRRDELAWIDAMAGAGSVLYVPCVAGEVGDVNDLGQTNDGHPLFADVRATVAWLMERGWQVEQCPAVAERALWAQFLGLNSSQVSGTNSAESGADARSQSRFPATAPTVQAHSYRSLIEEVRGTLAQVKALLAEGVLARDIALVARDERAYGPELMDRAWEYGVPLQVLYDEPFLSTRLGGWLTQLLAVLAANFPYMPSRQLLGHPLAGGPVGREGAATFWAAMKTRPQGWADWQAVAEAHLDLDLSALGQLKARRRRDTWVEWWQQRLGDFGLERRCARWAREMLAFNTLRRGLTALSYGEADLLSWPEFRTELEDLLALLTVPAQPGRGGVELHGPASVMGARYRHVFVVGMAEGMLPAPVTNDPVLDFYARRKLAERGMALPLAAELARREELTFAHLLTTATETLTLSYPRLVAGKPQLASAYFARLGLAPGEPPAMAPASDEELRRILLRQPEGAATPSPKDPVLRQARHAQAVEQYRESAASADEYDGHLGPEFAIVPEDWTFSASQFTSLGQCPFRWFAQQVLGLRALPEEDTDLSPSLRGQLYHRVVQRLVEAVQAGDGALNDPALLRRLWLAAEQEIGVPDLPTWAVQREEHLHHLGWAVQQEGFWPPGAEPVQMEYPFEGQWLGLRVTGRVDRVDRTATGLELIDYKTGKAAPKGIKDASGKMRFDVQLPLYQAAGLPPGMTGAVATTRYYSLKTGQDLKPSNPKSKTDESTLEQAIERCGDHLRQGHYPVQPDKARDACTYCDFAALCRRGDRLSRKENGHGPD